MAWLGVVVGGWWWLVVVGGGWWWYTSTHILVYITRNMARGILRYETRHKAHGITLSLRLYLTEKALACP